MPTISMFFGIIFMQMMIGRLMFLLMTVSNADLM